uniref:Uncharacterized protein n=1 Tax=Klebsiella pneumoniae TaxID=573 RepID=A0A2R4NEQ4_KLEPN|nr:hypothetical protein [Klebsiella pneumoniae]
MQIKATLLHTGLPTPVHGRFPTISRTYGRLYQGEQYA